jgi:polyhydroxyalkanoate synthesis regulator phasin
MVNEKIKSVVKDFLTKNNLSTDENMETLLLEVDNIKTLRDNVDKLIFEVKKGELKFEELGVMGYIARDKKDK